MKAVGQYAIHLNVPEHRRILLASMIDAAERHAGVLKSHWTLTDAEVVADASIVPDTASPDRLHLLVHRYGQIRRDLLLHWPIRSTELFTGLNQAALILNNPVGGESRAEPTGNRLQPRQAFTLLRDWRSLDSEGGASSTLLADGAPVLHLDGELDRAYALSKRLTQPGQLRDLSAQQLRWCALDSDLVGQPLGHAREIFWLLAEIAAGEGLLPEFEDSAISLRAWPVEIVHGPSSWTRAVKLLRNGPQMASQLAQSVAAPPAEISWFLNASLCSGYLRLRTPILHAHAEPATSRSTVAGGRFRLALQAIRQALGMSA